LRNLRDEEELFFQGREVASAPFYNSLRAFFFSYQAIPSPQHPVQSNISFFLFLFFHFSITVHLKLAKCMHWETSGAGGK
jgi:hypothetical protein